MAEFEAIAIVGISGRFPGARDLETFWANLVEGVDAVTEAPWARWRLEASSIQGVQGGFLDEVECFDARFFDMPPRDAEWMEPQQRLLLEHCWNALEEAGQLGGASRGTRAGVFVGMGTSDYPGAGSAALSALLSRFLSLEGPVLTMDAGGASSLAAIHQACQQLRAGLVDVAVAGGVFVMATPRFARELGGSSASGAHGFVPAEGVGVVVLKPLARALTDGNHIHGVIKGSGCRQDGASGSASRVALIREVHRRAGVEAESLSSVEAHGPGTWRVDALAAAGMAGVFKVLLSFEHRQLPPSLHFREQADRPQLEEPSFFINAAPLSWPVEQGTPRRAALSALGPGGTNCYLLLEEAPPAAPRAAEPVRPAYLFTVSARTQEALARSVANLASSLDRAAKHGTASHPGDVAFTLARGREHLEVRAAFVATELQELASTLALYLEKGEAPRAVVSRVGTLSERTRLLFRELAGSLMGGLNATTPESTWLEKLLALAELYVLGVDMDWTGLLPDGVYRRVPLPTYPFARERYWIPAGRTSASAPAPVPDSIPVLAAENPAPVRLPENAVVLEKVWGPEEPGEGPATPELFGTLVVLANSESAPLARAVFAHWRTACPFLIVDRAPTSPNHPRVDAILDVDSHEAGVRLGQRLNAEAAWIAGIIDLSDLRFGEQQRGTGGESVLGRLGLLQTVLRRSRSESFPLLHITRGLRPFAWSGPLALGGAVMASLVSKLGAEYANLHARTVDVDLTTADAATLAEVVLREFSTRDGQGETLYRQGRRYLPELRPVQVPAGSAPRISGDKVYVITGGVRGIGLEVARHLVSKGARRLVLMGVQPLPPCEQWPALLAEPRTEKTLRERIAPLHALESQGVALRVHSGPLSDGAALEALFQDVRASLGPIGGCFHAAGTVCFEPPSFVSKPLDTLRRVMEPKIDGLRTLERALAPDELDFFVLFSSVASVVPALSVGIADYATANGFMNLLAEQHRAEGRRGYQSIVWPNWKEVGMGEVGSLAYRALGFTAHSTADGLALLDVAMASGCVVPLPAIVEPERFDAKALLQPRTRQAASRPASAASAPLTPAPTPVPVQVPARVQVRAPTVSASPDLGAYALEWLRHLFSRELRLPRERLDPHAGFDTFGVDSIHIVELMVWMDGWLRMKLDPSLPLLHPTLAELSSHFVATYPAAVRAAFEREHPESPPASQVEVEPPASAVPAAPASLAAPLPSVARAVGEPIAVIGMACHFPGSPGLEAYWRTLREGRDCISEVPASRWRVEDFHASSHQPGKSMGRWGGFIEGIELFDPTYFGILEQDAPCIDPLMRQFLEAGVQCLQHAGYSRSELSGRPVGVFVGSRMSNYAARMPAPTRNGVIGSGQNFIAAHLSHFFDLKGPALVVDTACSSSLVALHLACQSLCSGESELALAGGVDILLDESVYLTLSESRALSRDGRCKTFDEQADGFVPGEGAGVVLLKPLGKALADGDRVYAVIDATAVNNDGHTMGITTPNPAGQRAVIQAALRAGGVNPATISYVEAHGTGTMIGDPIELRALTEVFSESTKRKGFCAVGSVKSNFGHLLSAAGISGLLKVVLSLMHRELPPTLHCQRPNPRFQFEASPFFPNTKLRPWEQLEGVRRAGLSSFGFGGTNAHALLSEAPADQRPRRAPLPPVVFSRKRYWLEKPAPAGHVPQQEGPRDVPRSRRPLLTLELESKA